jgi:hypothetical protein
VSDRAGRVNVTSPFVCVYNNRALTASRIVQSRQLLTVTFRQIVQADDVVFGRVELDFGLGFEGHLDGVFGFLFLEDCSMMFDMLERRYRVW